MFFAKYTFRFEIYGENDIEKFVWEPIVDSGDTKFIWQKKYVLEVIQNYGDGSDLYINYFIMLLFLDGNTWGGDCLTRVHRSLLYHVSPSRLRDNGFKNYYIINLSA